MSDVDAYLHKLDRELRTGLLSLLVMTILRREEEEQYGYQIIERLKQITDGGLVVPEGTIYPILHSLHEYGFVRTKWKVSENGPPRKYYRLTQDGERALEEGAGLWRSLVADSKAVLGSLGGS